ncbi:hypothetical protein N658DRAFT_494141 [Parathielavia hyrcaniae]|uniref:Uncharacterized protein n=1 Tax=Parathielavia hyrcaniae TaxID=113614 RepID=A0AAN6Q4X5_9PEZI|nr:hypothetical protein N658DRAFT_494141 [Parathielavia hyrcaniae]
MAEIQKTSGGNNAYHNFNTMPCHGCSSYAYYGVSLKNATILEVIGFSIKNAHNTYGTLYNTALGNMVIVLAPSSLFANCLCSFSGCLRSPICYSRDSTCFLPENPSDRIGIA